VELEGASVGGDVLADAAEEARRFHPPSPVDQINNMAFCCARLDFRRAFGPFSPILEAARGRWLNVHA